MNEEQLEEMEDLVPEEGNENVEQPTEESQEVTPEEKKYTESEFNKRLAEEVDRLLPQKLERRTSRIRKETEGQYGELLSLLRASTGKQDIGEITESLRQGVGKSGGKGTQKPQYSDEDIGILARAEAEDIIRSGEDEVDYELGRLGKEGMKLDKRQQETVRILQEHKSTSRRDRELAELGVPEDVRKSEQFQAFASQFKDSVPMKDVYRLYEKGTKPQKKIETMGSMRTGAGNQGVKDYYSPEEIAKLSEADLDNDEVWQAVRRSMTGK